jgi:hypothetical protein
VKQIITILAVILSLTASAQIVNKYTPRHYGIIPIKDSKKTFDAYNWNKLKNCYFKEYKFTEVGYAHAIRDVQDLIDIESVSVSNESINIKIPFGNDLKDYNIENAVSDMMSDIMLEKSELNVHYINKEVIISIMSGRRESWDCYFLASIYIRN